MQEEVNQKTVSFCIHGGKITARILKAAIRLFLTKPISRKIESKRSVKQAEKNAVAAEYAKEDARQEIRESRPHGRQSMKSLMSYGTQLTNIKITDNNIKSFDRVARKYGIDYSLKRDNSKNPPDYLVFFKARDVDVMTAAFKEYAGVTLDKEKKPSVVKKLQKKKEAVRKHRQRERVKVKDRGQSL